MTELQKKIEELKELRIQEILNSNECIINKLGSLGRENLFDIKPYLQNVFEDWKKEYEEKELQNSKKNYIHINDIFDIAEYPRYSTLDLSTFLSNLHDNLKNQEELLIVFTNNNSDTIFEKKIFRNRKTCISMVY